MRQPNLIHRLHAACRWLGPWAIVLAMSALIAHTAEAVLIPPVIADSLAAERTPTLEVYKRFTVDKEGAMTHVQCSEDVNEDDAEVLVTSLQDLQLLEDGGCQVRP